MSDQPRHPESHQEECKALEAYLTKIMEVKEPFQVKMYAFVENQDGFRISEIDICCDTGGVGWMRGNADIYGQALILAAEDFVRSYHVKPFRPDGWESDLDEFADAKWILAETVKELKKEDAK